jgi:hypothetical protein
MNPIGRIGTCSLMCTLACLEPLPAMPTSLYLTLAQDINDAGEIIGSAIDTAATPKRWVSPRFQYSTAAAIHTSRPRPKPTPVRWFSPNVCVSSFQSSFA